MEKKPKRFDRSPKEKPKRMGRPPKPPVSGERVSLGLRVTAEVKRQLDDAAARSGRSQSQEAEWRLENSLKSDKQLMLVQGNKATSVGFRRDEMLIPVDYGEVVSLKVTFRERQEILDFFRDQYPGEQQVYHSEEVEAAGDREMQMQRDIKRGK